MSKLMPHVELRSKAGQRSPSDLLLVVQDKTFDYLMSSPAKEIRVSAYLDQDWPNVEAIYEELFVADICKFESKVTKVIAGSRVRKNITLPGAMTEGEQITVLVTRTGPDQSSV
jgi:hypothetical protein